MLGTTLGSGSRDISPRTTLRRERLKFKRRALDETKSLFEEAS
jgi:hypothetical protein